MITIGKNMIAENIQRNLTRSATDLSRVSERLSSGQRINSASDDAAGLAIANKLTTDKRLNQQAVRNINDGISVINIVSSALDAQKGIIERMSELAAQGANSTYTSQQRQALQNEYTALLDEFDRIGSTTEFNGVNLLRNSTPQSLSFMTGITGEAGSLIEIAAANSHRYAGVVAQRSNWHISSSGNDAINVLDANALRAMDITSTSELILSYIQSDQIPTYGVINTVDSLGRKVEVSLYLLRYHNDEGRTLPLPATADIQSVRYSARSYAQDGSVAETIGNSNPRGQVINPGAGPIPLNLTVSFSFASGATGSVSLDLSGTTFSSYDVDPQGTQPSAIGFTNVLSQRSSRLALPVLQNRLNELSQIQSQFGAMQSRLAAAYNLRAGQNEVLAAAASRIMDADIAADSAQYVRTTILQQTGAALLAQANQQPALALRLLRG